MHGRSLPLKRGLIKYAYTRKLPVQIVIGANKESILSEKHHTARFGQTAAVGYSGGRCASLIAKPNFAPRLYAP